VARPDPKTKAERAERKQHWAQVREQAAAEREEIRVHVAGLAGAALVPAGDMGKPSAPEEIRGMLRRAFDGAMRTEAWLAAEKCAISLAKFDGLFIERSQTAMAIGTPDQFRVVADDEDERCYAMVARDYGPETEKTFRKFVTGMRKSAEKDAALKAGHAARPIEHEPKAGE
jgi:hypothetical protein